jgi:hypothetical protein
MEYVKIKDKEYPVQYGIRCEYILVDDKLKDFDKEIALLYAALKSGCVQEGVELGYTKDDLELMMNEDRKIYIDLAAAFGRCVAVKPADKKEKNAVRLKAKK